MGCKVQPVDRERSTSSEGEHQQILANALSGNCYAIPCQVRNETYVKVKGKWCYYYRAVDKCGKTLDFMLSEKRDEAAATAFFRRAIGNNGFPDRVVIDKSGSNMAGLNNINMYLLWNGWFWMIDVLQVKYLNNIIEQDHRFIKNLTKQMRGFKSLNSAAATLGGIEVAHMIRKRQLGTTGQSAFHQFAALAG